MALDAATGKTLWHVYAGGNLTGAPMTYELGGRQYVITAVDSVLYAWALPVALSPPAQCPAADWRGTARAYTAIQSTTRRRRCSATRHRRAPADLIDTAEIRMFDGRTFDQRGDIQTAPSDVLHDTLGLPPIGRRALHRLANQPGTAGKLEDDVQSAESRLFGAPANPGKAGEIGVVRLVTQGDPAISLAGPVPDVVRIVSGCVVMTLFQAGLAGAVDGQQQVLTAQVVLSNWCSRGRVLEIFTQERLRPRRFRCFAGLSRRGYYSGCCQQEKISACHPIMIAVSETPGKQLTSGSD